MIRIVRRRPDDEANVNRQVEGNRQSRWRLDRHVADRRPIGTPWTTGLLFYLEFLRRSIGFMDLPCLSPLQIVVPIL